MMVHKKNSEIVAHRSMFRGTKFVINKRVQSNIESRKTIFFFRL